MEKYSEKVFKAIDNRQKESGKYNSIPDPARYDDRNRLRRRRYSFAGGMEKRWPHDDPSVSSVGSGFPRERRRKPSVEIEAFQQARVLQPLSKYAGWPRQERALLRL